MRYFEMLKIIYDNNLEISFRKSNLGGIRVEVSKVVGHKLLMESKELTNDALPNGAYHSNNNYIPEMIANVLQAEKEITLHQNNDP